MLINIEYKKQVLGFLCCFFPWGKKKIFCIQESKVKNIKCFDAHVKILFIIVLIWSLNKSRQFTILPLTASDIQRKHKNESILKISGMFPIFQINQCV